MSKTYLECLQEVVHNCYINGLIIKSITLDEDSYKKINDECYNIQSGHGTHEEPLCRILELRTIVGNIKLVKE